MQTAMEICDMCLQNGEPVTKDYLCTFIDLINDIKDTELMLNAMHFLNALIRKQWSASMQPLAYLCFPVIRDQAATDSAAAAGHKAAGQAAAGQAAAYQLAHAQSVHTQSDHIQSANTLDPWCSFNGYFGYIVNTSL